MIFHLIIYFIIYLFSCYITLVRISYLIWSVSCRRDLCADADDGVRVRARCGLVEACCSLWWDGVFDFGLCIYSTKGFHSCTIHDFGTSKKYAMIDNGIGMKKRKIWADSRSKMISHAGSRISSISGDRYSRSWWQRFWLYYHVDYL